ncbi:unnamed protein product [Aureobasidium mustum]|uniref:Uncharacterized protein n=1 Tax=Aureobasidium mustum TaxID=2773714 RepID=A0A9N8PM52_9PEZI|nr:unnamed protein product [Aureobasidium mustum]
MNPPASFSSLPPELVSKICSDPGLSKKDLVALRLTSKSQHIHVSATRAFGKRYFTKVPILFTKYSLETFAKICQHSIFSACIRTVELSCARTGSRTFNYTLRDLTHRRLSRNEILQRAQLLAERCDNEEKLDVEDARAKFVQAFAQLAKSDHSIALAVSSNEFMSIGESKVYEASTASDRWYADIPSAVWLLLFSAMNTGCKVHKLEIYTFAQRYINTITNEHYPLSELLRSIPELDLDLTLVAARSTVPPGALQVLNDLLSWSTNVKILHVRLSLNNTKYDDFESFSKLISALPFEELDMKCVQMLHDVLISLMKGLGRTLRRLTMSECFITGSWDSVLLHIQQHQHGLQFLHISRCNGPWKKVTKTYEGNADIRSGVAELLQARQLVYNLDDDDDSDTDDLIVLD